MKKINLIVVTLLSFLFINQSFAQGWVGSSNNLYPVNTSLQLSPLNVGIGTNTPLAQFHTTGSLRFSGITNDNTYSRVLVQNTSGDVYWRDASTIGTTNAWLLNGNNGTNPATNFVGTIDNQVLNFRTDNTVRLSLNSTVTAGANNIGHVFIGQTAAPNNPGQLNIYGKDIAGFSIPTHIMGSIVGMNWSPVGGSTNTLGRLSRLSQLTNGVTGAYQFYDLGIGQDSAFYIAEHEFSGAAGIFPTKMITISQNNRVGINIPWGTSPSATLHSIGTVRFQNLPSGTGNILVIDAQGNVFQSSATAKVAKDESLQKELNNAKQTIRELQNSFEELKKEIAKLKGQLVYSSQPYIKQNYPNPGVSNTTIEYFIPDLKKGKVLIYDATGKVLRIFGNLPNGKNYINLDMSQYKSGAYLYSLVVNGKEIDSKKMVIN